MTILNKMKNGSEGAGKNTSKKDEDKPSKPDAEVVTQADLTAVESQFKHMMDEFRANAGFNVNTGEQPYDTIIELLSSKGVNAAITVLLSFIRYCVNHNLKKEITVKIGYNKPTSIPMNFAVNEELLEEIYPGDVVEIN